jgi:hypothetical protein
MAECLRHVSAKFHLCEEKFLRELLRISFEAGYTLGAYKNDDSPEPPMRFENVWQGILSDLDESGDKRAHAPGICT